MSSLTFQSAVELPSGNKIPRLGFGVAYGYGSTKKHENPAEITKPSLLEALKAGYRHVDTAEMYGNEKEVGDAIKESGVKREELFITSKVPSEYSTYEQATKVLNESLRAIGTEYLDLYLIHDPPVGTKARLEQWTALVDAKKQGKFKDIGVSNFGIKHLEEIRESGLEPPAVNQVEIHPFCQQKEIVNYCKKHKIVVVGYCTVVRGAMDHPTIIDIAKKHNKDPAQVLIRWSLQKGFVALMRSSNPARIRSNADIYDFELTQNDMDRLKDLDCGDAGAISWNPIHTE